MPLAVEALIPVTLCVLIGFIARHHFRIGNDVWSGLERLTYFLFAPCLLTVSLANKPLQAMDWQGIGSTLVLVILLCSLIIIAVQWLFKPFDGPSFTSVFQGGVRFNVFVALAMTEQLFGSAGAGIGALGSVIVIVSVNLLCVSVFSVAGHNSGGWAKLPKQLATNPLILGCLAGMSLNLSGIGVSGATESLLTMLGKAALPMALLAVGAALRPASTKGYLGMIGFTSSLQFILKPLVAIFLAGWFGLDAMTTSIVVLCLAVPTAPSAYVLARQLGGNAQAMATIITAQTLIAFITLPITLSFVLPSQLGS